MKLMSQVILVNRQDKVIGAASRQKAHRVKGLLHRGFISLIFNQQGELLLVKRSQKKQLWPLFWDGCCSHPRSAETNVQAAERRLKEELGFTCSLECVDKFYYRSVYENVGGEEEICAILTGQYYGKITPDPDEIAEYRWIKMAGLKKEMKNQPEAFAPWLKRAMKYVN